MITSIRVLTLIGIMGLVTLSFFSVLPVVRASGSGCSVNFSLPSGQYSFGSTETGTITTACGGTGFYILTDTTTATVTGPVTFSCPTSGCSSTVILNQVLPPDTYSISANFTTNMQGQKAFALSIFQVSQPTQGVPEFPFGLLAIFALAVPALVLFRSKFSYSARVLNRTA